VELGAKSGDLGKSPEGFRGEAPVDGLGSESPEAGAFKKKINNMEFKAL